MKKLIYPISIAALLLASCGESSAEASPDLNDAKTTLSACDCKKESEAKVKELEEDCKDYTEADYKECK